MPRYEVTRELIVTCRLKQIVEADSADDAVEVPFFERGPHGSATTPAECGWRASVTLKAPKGVQLVSSAVKAAWFDAASGGEKVRKLPDQDAA